MKGRYELVVIGAGPAGMAAANVASEHGAEVLVLDEQPDAGGQIYRAITRQTIKDKSILGDAYYEGKHLADTFSKTGAEHIRGASVWQVSQEREVGVSRNGAAHLLHADQIIIATGAQERPFPVPGWTLPGVMMAGGAQALLKSSGVTFSNAVFVGTGPLLFLIAYQYLKAGVPIRAILETTPSHNRIKALPHLVQAMSSLDQLLKGRKWIKELRASGIEYVTQVENLKLRGADQLEAVEYSRQGRWHKIDTSTALLHQGVVPNINMAAAAGCNHAWNDQQLCWIPQVTDWMETNVAGISIAGDSGEIGGAKAAQYQGEIAAYNALYHLGKLDETQRNGLAMPSQKALDREMRIRPFLDILFRPSEAFRIPIDDETLICRCEEVTAGSVRDAVALGCLGPNQLKSFTRCGMGPCQGRFCSLTVSQLIAKSRGLPVADLEALRLRPPIKPLVLSELANLSMPENQETQ